MTAPTSVTNITGFLSIVTRIELLEGFADRRNDNRRIEDGVNFSGHRWLIDDG